MFGIIILGFIAIMVAAAFIIYAVQDANDNNEGFWGFIKRLLELFFTTDYGGYGCMAQIGFFLIVIIIMAIFRVIIEK